MDTFESLISLNLIGHIGSVALEKLLKVFNKPEDIFKANKQDLINTVGEKLAESIISFEPKCLKNDLSLAKRTGIRIITILDQDYPQILKEIPGPPIVLYVLGSITKEDDLAIGIVGSRHASFYGLSSTEKFAYELSVRKVTIVSGLARGIDTCAHKAALKAGGRTIAVIGSGLSNIYPEENKDLVEKIALNGAVVSEFPMETAPLPQNFPRRNRIISGLSKGILVTEAARNSGALITADFALEQGREVFALPGRIDANNSLGTNKLLKQGAKLVTCCEDILEEFNLFSIDTRKQNIPDSVEKTAGNNNEGLLYNCIDKQVIGIDDLIEKTSLPSSQVLSLILKLQFKKLIKELPGKHFIRN